MKKRDLEKALKQLGFSLLRQGAGHEVWSNGERNVTIPRHREIKEDTARGIIKQAKGG